MVLWVLSGQHSCWTGFLSGSVSYFLIDGNLEEKIPDLGPELQQCLKSGIVTSLRLLFEVSIVVAHISHHWNLDLIAVDFAQTVEEIRIVVLGPAAAVVVVVAEVG